MRILLAVSFILLSACAGQQVINSSPPDAQLWQHHQQQVTGIHSWNITGRVAVNTGNNGGNADLFWQQRDEQDYDIKLVAPFGSGSSLIQARADGVLLSTSDGQQVYEPDIDSLLAHVDDMHFPVSGLRYWIRGIPSPRSPAKLLSWNTEGRLNLLQQDGWRVQLRSYKQVGPYLLPNKVFISRPDDEDIDVRLVIRQWGIL